MGYCYHASQKLPVRQPKSAQEAEVSLRGPAATKTGANESARGIAQRNQLNEAALRGRGYRAMGIDSAGRLKGLDVESIRALGAGHSAA